MRRTVSFQVYLLIVVGCALAGVLFAALTSCGSNSETKPPSSCLRALDAAEVVIDKAGDAVGLADDYITGLLYNDGNAVEDANAKIKALADKVGDDADNYRRLAAECRGN